MTLPPHVDVGGHRFRIDASDETADLLHDEDANGDSRPDRSLIRLDPRRPQSQVAETLLHELTHCLWSLTGLPAHEVNEHQEMIVTALAPWLLEALRRNPDLVAYVTASGTGSEERSG
jgi:hypothetical protein